MRRLARLGLVLAGLFLPSAASAALIVSATVQPGALGSTYFSPGEVVTVDIQISTTRPEMLGLGLRAADYDPAILTSGTVTVMPTSIFNFSPSIPFGGARNVACGCEEAPLAGVRAGWSLNLFQGIAGAGAAGSGPDHFQIQFVMGAPGITTINIGAFHSYSDTYFGGDSVAQPVAIEITSVPEPATALLLGIGLAGLAGMNRRA